MGDTDSNATNVSPIVPAASAPLATPAQVEELAAAVAGIVARARGARVTSMKGLTVREAYADGRVILAVDNPHLWNEKSEGKLRSEIMTLCPWVTPGGFSVVGTALAASGSGPAPIVDKYAAAAAKAERKTAELEVGRNLDHLPDFLNFPESEMFPLRVLKQPRDSVTGELLPLQNIWFGLNGVVVHEIRGGVNADGSPCGIPGHSLPLGLTMYLVTEIKFPRDPGTNPAEGIVGLGNLDPRSGRGSYLPELLYRIGMKGNYRGANSKALSVIKRIDQYARCTHRLIVYRTPQEALSAYLQFKADGFAPSPAELSLRDSTESIVADYNIWTETDLVGTGADFRAYFKLTPAFLAGPVRHGIPMVRELVSRLLRNAQDVSLCALIAKRVYRMHKNGIECTPARKPIKVRSLQDQLGQNGALQNRRVGATIRAIHRVAAAWNAACDELGKPECKLRFEIDPGGGSDAATVRFWAAPSMVDFEMVDIDDDGDA